MEILSTFLTTVIEMILIGAVAFGGIRFGKMLRDRKDAKQAAQTAAENENNE